jgi:DNA-directed RNA polymerase subunit RPC12/RpoP
MTGANVSDDSIELLCNHCGRTFSAFLHEMADKNAKVACPNCREGGDCKPANAEPGAPARPVKKII